MGILNAFNLTMWLTAEDIADSIQSFFYKLLITLDSVVFYTIDLCYQVFLALARARIFGDNFFGAFIRRFYVLVGVAMMFFVVYTLLKVIVNPDDMTKGNMAPGKIVTNVLTSIILVTLLPTIFNVVYKTQNVLLDNDIIGRIVIGGSSAESIQSSVKKGGREIAVQVFSAFFYPEDGKKDTEITSLAEYKDRTYTLAEAKSEFVEENVSFMVFTAFSLNAAKDEIHYSWFISAIAGGFCLYVMVCFVFDVGIRAVKLGVLQIIAPVPVLMRVLPGKEKTFNSWVSLTASTFLEIFIRIFLIYMIALVAGQLPDIMDSMGDAFEGVGLPVKMLAQAFLLMGLIAFAKQAPKMLSDLFGIKSGNMGLSLAQRMNAGGGFAMGAAIGAGATTFGRNATNAYRANRAQQAEKGKNKWNDKLGAAVRSLPSAVGGAASGTVRGGIYGTKSKSFSDMAGAASKGAKKAVQKREQREQFYNDHGATKTAATNKVQGALDHLPLSGTKVGKAVTGAVAGAAGGVAAFAAGHGKELGESIKTWWTGDNVETLRARKKLMGDVEASMKAPKSKVEDEVKAHPNEFVYRYEDEHGVKHARTYASLVKDAELKREFAKDYEFEGAEADFYQSRIDAAKYGLTRAEAELENAKISGLSGAALEPFIKNVSDAKINVTNAIADYSKASVAVKTELGNVADRAEFLVEDALKGIVESQINYQMTGKQEYLVKFDKNDIVGNIIDPTTGEIDINKILDTFKTDADGKVIDRDIKGKVRVDGAAFADEKISSAAIAEVDDLLKQMKTGFAKNSATINRNIQDYTRLLEEQLNDAIASKNTALQAELDTQIHNMKALQEVITDPDKNWASIKLKDKLKAFGNINATISQSLAKKEKEEREKQEKK